MPNISLPRRDLLRIGSYGVAGAALPAISLTAAAKGTRNGEPLMGVFDVRKYGATGDGKTVDTPAINRAIDAAAAAGGGVVLFTA